MRKYLKIARFDHWIKQLFILPGIFAAAALSPGFNRANLFRVPLGFLATCFAASANYVINEWLDREFDQYHPVKKHRPCVSEGLKGRCVYAEYALFFICAAVIAYIVNRSVFITVVFLLIMGIIYNVKPFRSKDVPVIDVLSESVNNALRFLIGWFILLPDCLPPCSIVFGYWMVGAFLMAAKRFAEYRMIGDPETAKLYRRSFAGYTELFLLLSAVFYACLAVFFIGVFLIKYRIELLIVIPFLCGLFCYYLSLCWQPDSAAQKPEKLFREKKLMLFAAAVILLSVVLLYVRIPLLDGFTGIELIHLPI